jgi:zinc transport system substrate-binding protein
MPARRRLTLPAMAVAATALSACTPGAAAAPGAGPADDAVAVQVLASFYPLQYVAEQVGGDLVTVQSLTPPGVEPHDVELSPRAARVVDETDVVLYLSGFQSAVDDAIAARSPERVVDAADVVGLTTADGEAHAQDAHEEPAHEGHDHTALDPHFWLDPERLATLAEPVAQALADADPDHAGTYRERADALRTDLAALDADFRTGLASCERHVVVTSHEAFGYLTRAYGLEQVGISGVDPEAEPSPARLREIGDVVRHEGVTTIYTESLVNPKVARTLADDLRVTTAVLDPVESLVDPASDYRAVMERNLAALRAGLECA